jgi:ferredoxin-type protein NapH
MKSKRLRTLAPLVILLILSLGFMFDWGTGTLSAPGWQSISLLCPLGALGSMLAAKTIIPRVVFSLLIVVVLIVLFGRAFCSWICPVPLVSRMRNIFQKKREGAGDGEQIERAKDSEGDGQALTAEENALLKSSAGGCATCKEKRGRVDSRHLILGGALLSTVIFGFPVFCLVCPIGLTFATILLVVLLFGTGDVTLSLIVAPALLLVEVVFFRKWCSKICPLSAFMSLISKANRTFLPRIDKRLCLETTTHTSCGMCTNACWQGINLRNLDAGAAPNECSRCRACIDACPKHAISLPLIAVPAKRTTLPKQGSEQ